METSTNDITLELEGEEAQAGVTMCDVGVGEG